MELDIFKNEWNNQSSEDLKPSKNEAEVFLNNQSYGPVASLRTKFLNQLLIFPVAMVVLGYDLYVKPELWKSAEFGIFGLALLLLGVYFGINFLIVGKLQQYNASVKASMLRDVKRIENGLIWFQVVHAVLMIAMMVVVETRLDAVMNLELKDWYLVHPFLRGLAYVGILVLVLYLGRKRMLRTYGTHLNFLKAAIEKMEA